MDFKLLLCSVIAITWAMMDAKSADDPGFKSSSDDERKRELLKFRAKVEADTILDEDWRDMERLYPYKIVGGPPSSIRSVILYIPLGMWDLSNYAKLSDKDQIRHLRYTSSKMLEDASRKAGFNFHSTQNDIPKFDIVVDLEGTGRMFQGLGFDTKGVFKEQVELVVQKGIKALALLGKTYTTMYREQVGTLLFDNVPLGGPNLGCMWEPEGRFYYCRQECHENELKPCEEVIV